MILVMRRWILICWSLTPLYEMMITKLEMSLKLCWLCSETLTWSCETDIESFQKTSWRAILPWYFYFAVTSWIIWSLPPLCWEKLLKLHYDTKEQKCGYLYNCRTRCHPQRVNTPKTAWCQRWISAHSLHLFIHFVIDQKCHCTISGGPCRSIPSKLLCQTGRHKWSVLSHLNPDPSNQNKSHHNLFQSWYWRNSGDSYLCARRHELTMWAL